MNAAFMHTRTMKILGEGRPQRPAERGGATSRTTFNLINDVRKMYCSFLPINTKCCNPGDPPFLLLGYTYKEDLNEDLVRGVCEIFFPDTGA